ncbi:Signal transduction histidine kinase CheA [Labilithrix luteola]|uniref:histidine kinase n=1 Tax=Labilithrix luteola TaxID=1391654 RepID=A0A0K1PYW9_9BACT|nr:AAA family ATPase [Labilithrix luteola]AKU98708.1 Signal transduction histidine kinase CheA [Labilithrix luteola]
MNRSLDSRADLYAFGVTLYELLTATLPFVAGTPLEWVHCHIARQPAPLRERAPEVPEAVAQIVTKLLAKSADDRYQTASGVEVDLRRCLEALESTGQIDTFPLAAHDLPEQLVVPERLYGRERDIDALVSAFDRMVEGGMPASVFVSGYSGIGKSSVVHELHKTLAGAGGLLASGKFDQYKRDIPYATIAQAFQGAVRQLLGKDGAELAWWRRALTEALGDEGQLIVQIIPELALILPEQPPIVEVPPQEAQTRFQRLFRKFLGVFARDEHPLALFLDDLQWVDAATLYLLERLLAEPEAGQRFLVIGAYRENEVDASHPLTRALDGLRKSPRPPCEITLGPLEVPDLNRLVADALRCDLVRCRALAELVHAKTAGNPFFAIQFFTALADEGLLAIDPRTRAWTWDLALIRAKGFTENVADLMAGRLTRLPALTQEVLKHLACLGVTTDVATLHLVSGVAEDDLHEALWAAVSDGLIVRAVDSYRFIHDRVQEAAHVLIPEGERAESHLRLGRMLAARATAEQIAENVFDIVNHLNRGAALITSAEERRRVAELNLLAARRAQGSTAYASALIYLRAGRAMLTDDAWRTDYALCFALEFHRAGCEFLTGDLPRAAEQLASLATRAMEEDVAAVTRQRLLVHTAMDRNEDAVVIGLEHLRRVGIDWSVHPSDDEVGREFERMRQLLGDRSIESLVDLPPLEDAQLRATIDVLSDLTAAASYVDENLLGLVLLRVTNMSMEHGNSDGSCFAYVCLNMVVGHRFGDYASGFRFGKLAFELVEKRRLDRFMPRVSMCFGSMVNPWTNHIRSGRALVVQAFDAASRAGDVVFASYSREMLVTNLLVSGEPLAEVQHEAERGLAFARKARIGLVSAFLRGELQLVRALRGLTVDFASFDDELFDETKFEEELYANPGLVMATFRYWVRKVQLRFLAGDLPSALDAAEKAQRLLWTSPSFFQVAEYHFYAALAHAQGYDTASPEGRAVHRAALDTHRSWITRWRANCPTNFGTRAALVDAEVARIEDRPLDAERLYEEAIAEGRAQGFVQNEALANELAARFHAARNLPTIARAYLRNARYCYHRWGAEGKVRWLDRVHPRLQTQPSRFGEYPLDRTSLESTATIGATSEQLDLATVVRFSHAISQEIVLARLVETLLTIALEHAGAVRGVLLLCRNGELEFEAEGISGDRIRVRRRASPSDRAERPALPESILAYVVRSHESVILDDAAVLNSFSSDAYLGEKASRSVFCLPLVKQAQLIGVLYLENDLAPGVFTPSRIAVLRLVASQAAISLENARLYADLERTRSYMTEAERLGSVGSFGWELASGALSWSEEVCRILGYDRHVSPTVERVAERIHPEERDLLRARIEQRVAARNDFDVALRLRMPDGEVKHVEILAHATVDGTGQLLSYVGAVRDVTATKLASETLERTQAELAHVTRVATLGEMTASITHEINQPLAGVRINASTCIRWLSAPVPNIDEAREAARRASRDVTRASDVVARLRTLYRKNGTDPRPVDLNEAIEEVLQLMRAELRKNVCAVRAELEPRLPTAFGDRVQLQQVVMNLLLNGAEAMNEVADRPRELVVRTETHSTGEALVAVRDAGVGIPAAALEQVFEPFHTTKRGGMGMGLSISRKIVESHSGRLWASRNDRHGMTFYFTVATSAPPPDAR